MSSIAKLVVIITQNYNHKVTKTIFLHSKKHLTLKIAVMEINN